MNKDYCFCTLALGKSYRESASLLARDLELHAPETKFIVLTDEPIFFASFAHVKAFKHEPSSAIVYNDKRFAIERALILYDSCIFLDANVRIKNVVPQQINFQSGIVAYSCYALLKNFYKEGKSNESHRDYKMRNTMFKISQQIASYYNLNLNEVKFMFEGIFYVTRTSALEEFIEHWGIIGNYFELNGIRQEEGIAMGLAAAKAGFPINYDFEKKINVFKDVIEKNRIKKGQSTYEENAKYFEELKQIEENSSILSKFSKVEKKLKFYYRLARLAYRSNEYKDLFTIWKNIPTIELKNINSLAQEFVPQK